MCNVYEDDEEQEQEKRDLVDAMIALTNEIHALRYDVCKMLKIIDQFLQD